MPLPWEAHGQTLPPQQQQHASCPLSLLQTGSGWYCQSEGQPLVRCPSLVLVGFGCCQHLHSQGWPPVHCVSPSGGTCSRQRRPLSRWRPLRGGAAAAGQCWAAAPLQQASQHLLPCTWNSAISKVTPLQTATFKVTDETGAV